ncbi:unnamed protein product [Paramecium sonneborni]|uniref:Uncharacterized protein n=1 Tax=Paramecium sonneborni TaxID=65129 RepID=A0A8S1RIR4_9CILI|nr:unnamed protein product [Paramecium sonneborni]
MIELLKNPFIIYFKTKIHQGKLLFQNSQVILSNLQKKPITSRILLFTIRVNKF